MPKLTLIIFFQLIYFHRLLSIFHKTSPKIISSRTNPVSRSWNCTSKRYSWWDKGWKVLIVKSTSNNVIIRKLYLQIPNSQWTVLAIEIIFFRWEKAILSPHSCAPSGGSEVEAKAEHTTRELNGRKGPHLYEDLPPGGCEGEMTHNCGFNFHIYPHFRFPSSLQST